jgi:uncharacterized membrane protein
MKPAKIVWHHIHTMLIVIPLGLLAVSVLFDIAYLATHEAAFATIAFWDMLAGIIGGLAAAVFGFWDWLTIQSGTRAKRIGACTGSIWSSWSASSPRAGSSGGWTPSTSRPRPRSRSRSSRSS